MNKPSDYLGKHLRGDDLQGREWLVTIQCVLEEDVSGDPKKPDVKPVAYFRGRRKDLPLNQGNLATLIRAFGDDFDAWRGVAVILFPEPTKTPAGVPVTGVRIKLPQTRTEPRPRAATQVAITTLPPDPKFTSSAQQRAAARSSPSSSEDIEPEDEAAF